MKYKYNKILVNFKEQHNGLHKWVKDHCKSEGMCISQLIRDLLSEYKRKKEEVNEQST